MLGIDDSIGFVVPFDSTAYNKSSSEKFRLIFAMGLDQVAFRVTGREYGRCARMFLDQILKVARIGKVWFDLSRDALDIHTKWSVIPRSID